jgi:hypothetical protein
MDITMPRLSSWGWRRAVRLAVLAVGPLLTLGLLSRVGAPETGAVSLAAVLLWSPLFCSLPALLLQHERDIALGNIRASWWRGLKLLPYLAASPDSTVRPEIVVSVVSWAVLAVTTREETLAALARMFG